MNTKEKLASLLKIKKGSESCAEETSVMKIKRGTTMKRKGIEGFCTTIHIMPCISIHKWDKKIGIQFNFLFWWINISFKENRK